MKKEIREVKTINVNDIKFREDLYPRFEADNATIQKYANSVEYLPPIKVNQDNILIDGFHRWKAFMIYGEPLIDELVRKINECKDDEKIAEYQKEIEALQQIKCEIITTDSEQQLKCLAYQTNANHGLQLSSDEKRKFAQEMFGILTEEQIRKILSISKATYYQWTTTQRSAKKTEHSRLLLEQYLNGVTLKDIADNLEINYKTVKEVFSKIRGNLSEIVLNAPDFHDSDETIDNSLYPNEFPIPEDIEEIESDLFDMKYFKVKLKSVKEFKPDQLYNIWNLAKQDNSIKSHFGSFPKIFMENLLYYHTEPFDMVYDPFTGGGTTVESCKKLLRRYYCTDRKVKPGLEKDVKEWDIKDGMPKDMPKPNFVFLDPPYWLLAKEEYSNDDTDLGNMDKDTFYDVFYTFVKQLMQRKVDKIAYVIRPIWITENGEWQWEDPMIDFINQVQDKYEIETRYVLPYSTQQYSGLWVNRAKQQKKNLILNRELTVFKRRV